LLFFLDRTKSVPSSAHVETLCGAIARANLELDTVLGPLLITMSTTSKALCVQSPAFLNLVRTALAQLEAKQRRAKDAMRIPFNKCTTSSLCATCNQLEAFCINPASVATEVAKAGAGSKNRKHLMAMLQSYGDLVVIKTHTSR
jgi:hypothetical protein